MRINGIPIMQINCDPRPYSTGMQEEDLVSDLRFLEPATEKKKKSNIKDGNGMYVR